MVVRCFKLIDHPFDFDHTIEIDHARYRISTGAYVANLFMSDVYSFGDVIFPLSQMNKLENILNMIDIGKESADFFSMVRHTTQTEPDVTVTTNLHMDGPPKPLGYKLGVSMFGDLTIRRVLQNPSATLIIQRKPHVEFDDSFLVTVELPAELLHTNGTKIETTECGDLKITLKKLKAMRILSLSCSVHKYS